MAASTELKQKLKSLGRYIKFYVDIWFDDESPSSSPTRFDVDNVLSWSILEELYASDDPLGTISANSLDLSLDNKDNRFSVSNTNSPYYGKLLPGKRVDVWISTELGINRWEDLKIGQYYIEQWTPKVADGEVDILAYDKLAKIIRTPCPIFPVKFNTNAQQLYISLFNSIGVTTDQLLFKVDLTTYNFPIFWTETDTIGRNLQRVAEATNTIVYVNREGLITIDRYIGVQGSVVDTMTSEDLVCSADPVQNLLAQYSQVAVSNYRYDVQPSSEICNVSITIPARGIQIVTGTFSDTPVIFLEDYLIVGNPAVILQSIKYDACQYSLTIQSTSSQSQVVTFIANGRVLKTYETVNSVFDSKQTALIGTKTKSIQNQLITDVTFAKAYASQLLTFYIQPIAQINVDVRQNPSWTVGDRWAINDRVNQVSANCVIVRNQIKYDGGLDGEIVLYTGDLWGGGA